MYEKIHEVQTQAGLQRIQDESAISSLKAQIEALRKEKEAIRQITFERVSDLPSPPSLLPRSSFGSPPSLSSTSEINLVSESGGADDASVNTDDQGAATSSRFSWRPKGYRSAKQASQEKMKETLSSFIQSSARDLRDLRK